MKRFFYVCVCALFVLCGCGKSSGTKKTIGVAIPSASHGWTGGVVWFAERVEKKVESKNPDVNVVTVTSTDSANQVSQIENLIAQGVDALVIMAQEPAPIRSVCEAAKKQGIFLVIVSNPLTNPVQDVFVNGDNRSFGAAAAKAIGGILGGKGNIVALEGYSSPINTERMTAFTKTLGNEYPSVRILASDLAEYNAEKALTLMENYLQKFPDIDAVWAGDDDALLGVVKAISNFKGEHHIKAVIGGGGSKKVVKMILDNDPLVKATVTYPPAMIETGVYAALDGIRNNGTVKNAEIVVPSEIVLKENGEKYYFPESVY